MPMSSQDENSEEKDKKKRQVSDNLTQLLYGANQKTSVATHLKKIVLQIIGHPLKSIYQLKPHDKMFAFCLNKYLISRENPGADDVYSAWFFDLAGIFLINGLDSKHLMKKCSWYLLTLSEKDLQLKEGAIFKINLPFQISSFARIFSI